MHVRLDLDGALGDSPGIMKVTQTELPGVLLVEPKVFGDHRGFFVETYSRERYAEVGIDATFVQDNMSSSTKGILRGLHYQVRKPQAKLVSVVQGEIFDVVVDIRPGSPTFGRWVGARLDHESKRQLYAPVGFAHGFCVLSDLAVVTYKCSDYYDPKGEGGIVWNDPELGIAWPVENPVLSAKDAGHPPLSRAVKFPD
jgi:dTDP-4-dehydrorhamnose 3,5-epimerase